MNLIMEKFQKILSEDSTRSFKSHLGDFKSLGEFRNALEMHKENLYSSYVNSAENHFANWVEGVFQDNQLANSLRNAKSADEALSMVDKRLAFARLSLENEGFFSNFLPSNPLTTDFTPATDKFHRNFDSAAASSFILSYFEAKKGFEKKLDVALVNKSLSKKQVAKPNPSSKYRNRV